MDWALVLVFFDYVSISSLPNSPLELLGVHRTPSRVSLLFIWEITKTFHITIILVVIICSFYLLFLYLTLINPEKVQSKNERKAATHLFTNCQMTLVLKSSSYTTYRDIGNEYSVNHIYRLLKLPYILLIVISGMSTQWNTYIFFLNYHIYYLSWYQEWVLR